MAGEEVLDQLAAAVHEGDGPGHREVGLRGGALGHDGHLREALGAVLHHDLRGKRGHICINAEL